MGKYRIEKDSLGEVQVPEVALYGAQTQRGSLPPPSRWRAASTTTSSPSMSSRPALARAPT
jgi:fumarate hydratase class II